MRPISTFSGLKKQFLLKQLGIFSTTPVSGFLFMPHNANLSTEKGDIGYKNNSF
jgi:hypothetical protein